MPLRLSSFGLPIVNELSTGSGAAARVTTTENAFEAGLPAGSDVEQITVVVPTGKTDPDGGEHVTLGFVPELSCAAGAL